MTPTWYLPIFVLPSRCPICARTRRLKSNIVDPFARKGYRFKGAAELVIGGELFDKILSFYRNRWVDTARSKPEPSIQTFVLVEVQRALPLISPAYDDGSDESGIRATWVAYFKVLNEKNTVTH